jgi:hypothetical protein
MIPGKTRVATFNEAEKAQVVKNKLEKAGMSATLEDESKLQKFCFLSRQLASHRVYVGDENAEKARQLLIAADATDHIMDGAVHCLQCGSARVDYPQFTRKFMTTTFVEIFCLLRLIDKTFYCQDCHFTWPPAVSLRRKADILNWPQHKDGLVRQEKG